VKPDRGQWQAGSLAGAAASIVGRSGGNTRIKKLGYMLGNPVYLWILQN